ncbi:MAG: DNA polymerase IV, partial [Dongiaceae bacterium]
RARTPLVEPLSIDEAFLDLSGTAALHHGSPARTMAALALEIERQLAITVSIGLSYNKFLAKVASDLDKPRGFAVLGRAEAAGFLAARPVSLIWGVGKNLQERLAADGIASIAQLQQKEEADLMLRYGAMGRRLYRFARGEDSRKVDPEAPTKSVSAETTFETDTRSAEKLAEELWPLCERVSRRLKRNGFSGRTVTLKLKTADFQIVTRRTTLPDPTQLAERLYQAARPLLKREADGRLFRLIGVGASDLGDSADADPIDLADPTATRRKQIERAIDAVRDKLGTGAIAKGRGFQPAPPKAKPPRAS